MIYRIEVINPELNCFGGLFRLGVTVQMEELGLPVPDYAFNKPPDPPIFLAGEDVKGIDIEVTSLEDYGQSAIAYRDEYQIAFLLPGTHS